MFPQLSHKTFVVITVVWGSHALSLFVFQFVSVPDCSTFPFFIFWLCVGVIVSLKRKRNRRWAWLWNQLDRKTGRLHIVTWAKAEGKKIKANCFSPNEHCSMRAAVSTWLQFLYRRAGSPQRLSWTVHGACKSANWPTGLWQKFVRTHGNKIGHCSLKT